MKRCFKRAFVSIAILQERTGHHDIINQVPGNTVFILVIESLNERIAYVNIRQGIKSSLVAPHSNEWVTSYLYEPRVAGLVDFGKR